MASEGDIWNMMLSHCGEDATVTGANPPSGSAHDGHCAIFYPIARDTLLQKHTWNFNTRRVDGAEVTPLDTGWQYAYAKPNNALCVFAVLPPGSQDDYVYAPITGDVTLADGSIQSPGVGMTTKSPQPFAMETASDGSEIIVTNQAEAVIRYGIRVTDTSKFPPLFVTTLSYLGASLVAGPIIKGKEGRAVAKELLQMANFWLAEAIRADTKQRNVNPRQTPSSIQVRS